MARCLAIDIGGSKVICALVSEQGEVLSEYRQEFSARPTKEEVLEKILAGVKKLPADPVAVCGVTIPGLADPETGMWIYAPYSGIRDFPIAKELESRLGVPVFADNDVNACALAERRWGECQDMTEYAWITVSNGVGGAIVLGGNIYPGAYGGSGEIGHLCVDPDGALCPCGKRGCLEASAAGPAIAKRYKKAAGLSETNPIDAAKIAELAHQGDETAQQVFYQTGVYLGKAIAAVANILNPQAVIIGGGVSQSFDLLEEGINESYLAEAFAAVNSDMPIMQTGLGYEAALRGAATLGFLGLEKAGKEGDRA